jgi:hypothetical protein
MEVSMDDHARYVADLEQLVRVRTEQLRTAVGLVHELTDAIRPYRPDLAKKATDTLENG